MRSKLLATAAVTAAASLLTAVAHASFAREFERYNRNESAEILDDLDREIQIRIDEAEGKEPEDPFDDDVMGAGRKAGWRIKPALGYQAVRQSNFFERRNDAVGESVYTYAPSLTALKRFDAWKYRSEYELSFVHHRNFDHNDRDHHAWSQSVVREDGKFTTFIGNEFLYQGFPSETADEEVSEFITNSFFTQIEYRHSPKTRLTAYYNNQYASFKRTIEKASNSDNNTFGVRLGYRKSPRTELFADYSYRLSRPPKSPDETNINAQTLLLGTQTQISPKIFLNAGVGVESREFAATDDKLGLTVQGALRYIYSPRTDFSLSFQRDTVPVATESSSDPLNNLVALEGRHKLTKLISIGAHQSIRLTSDATTSTVVDPENPSIITTKADEAVFLYSGAGLQFGPLKNWLIILSYDFERVVSELQVGDRTNHISKFEVAYDF